MCTSHSLPVGSKRSPTPRITRRPAPLLNDESLRVGGRVHALVRPLKCAATKRSQSRGGAFKRPNAAHHAPRGPAVKFNSRRVRGRVHALVMRRSTPAVTRARRDYVVAPGPLAHPMPFRDTAA